MDFNIGTCLTFTDEQYRFSIPNDDRGKVVIIND